jgi:hypothetical protein
MTAGSDALGFREECLLLQLNCDLLVGSQDHAYSSGNDRNRENAAQRLQRFMHWKVSFEATFHRRFAMLALNVHGHRSKFKSRFSRLMKDICDLN